MQKLGMIIGQAPPKGLIERPFGRTRLYQWFEAIGFSREFMSETFEFGSLVVEFPGSGKSGHLPPQPDKIAEHRPKLITIIDSLCGNLIIPVGKMAIHAVMGQEAKLEEVVGKQFTLYPFGECKREATVIPLPHPSGVSTWHYKPENRQLLAQALVLIRDAVGT